MRIWGKHKSERVIQINYLYIKKEIKIYEFD